MTPDYERHAMSKPMPASDQTPSRNMASIRVIIEGVAVAGIIWLANSFSNQNAAIGLQNISITRLQVQVTQMQVSLADIPALTRATIQVQSEQSDHDRRIADLENGSQKASRWKR